MGRLTGEHCLDVCASFCCGKQNRLTGQRKAVYEEGLDSAKSNNRDYQLTETSAKTRGGVTALFQTIAEAGTFFERRKVTELQSANRENGKPLNSWRTRTKAVECEARRINHDAGLNSRNWPKTRVKVKS
jgi:hypothetical protein